MREALLLSLFGLFIVLGVNGTFAQARAETKQNVAILLFDGVQIIDYTGPYEVLGSGGRRNVFTVTPTGDQITTAMGMKVVPHYSIDNHPKIDILILPGGGNIESGPAGRGVGAQLDDPKVITWVKEQAAHAKYVMSVCNGAFFLAKAGLLANLPATTTAGFISSLPRFSPTTTPVYDKRFVDNGKIITTAGLSSGIDGAMHLVEKLDGRGWAKQTALGIEYNWQPESGFTRGAIADMKLPQTLGNVFAPASYPIDMGGGQSEWQEKWSIPTDATPAEFLASVDKEWAKAEGWTKVPTEGSRTRWKLTERSGGSWNGWAAVERGEERGKLILTLGISSGKNLAETRKAN